MREKRHSPFSKRRQWDSNPRALADNRISSAARYDHFDTLPYMVSSHSFPIAGENWWRELAKTIRYAV